jgi:hypothetical protein
MASIERVGELNELLTHIDSQLLFVPIQYAR